MKPCSFKLPDPQLAGGDPDDEEDEPRDGAVEVNMTVDESGDVSMLSGEVHKWFTLHAELPSEARMDPALLVANTHILFNPKRGDIKVGGPKLDWLPVILLQMLWLCSREGPLSKLLRCCMLVLWLISLTGCCLSCVYVLEPALADHSSVMLSC